MGNYITKSEISNWSPDYSDEEKENVIESVEALVENVTQSFFYPKDFTIELVGNGKLQVIIPVKYQLLSVTSLTVDGESISNLRHNKYSVTRLDNETFPQGSYIVLECKVGADETPAGIKRACRILCEVENGSVDYKIYSYDSEDEGDYSYDRGGRKYLTGVDEADKLLRPYLGKGLSAGRV